MRRKGSLMGFWIGSIRVSLESECLDGELNCMRRESKSERLDGDFISMNV